MRVLFKDGTEKQIDADGFMCQEGTTMIQKRLPWRDGQGTEHQFQTVEEIATHRIKNIDL